MKNFVSFVEHCIKNSYGNTLQKLMQTKAPTLLWVAKSLPETAIGDFVSMLKNSGINIVAIVLRDKSFGGGRRSIQYAGHSFN